MTHNEQSELANVWRNSNLQRNKPEILRFWEKVDFNGPMPEHWPNLGNCWIWAGALDKKGYGAFNGHRSHRWIYQKTFGILNPEMLVCHHCDNPACVRVGHLFKGTTRDNAIDSMNKGRAILCAHRRHLIPQVRGEKQWKAKLNTQKVKEIRKMSSDGCSHKSLAKLFEVNPSCIDRVVSNKTWRHVI